MAKESEKWGKLPNGGKARTSAKWEPLGHGGRILRLYKTSLNPGWPEIVILDLPAKMFRDFEYDPIGFDKKYKLFPNRIRWISSCGTPPRGEESPKPSGTSRWMVVIEHCRRSYAVCAASPHEAS